MIKALALAVAALAGMAQAINFTTDVSGQTYTKGSVVELDWSTVDTDPSTLSIYLVNFVEWPPLTYSLAEDISTFKGKAWVRIPCDVDSTTGFQFNAINGTNTYVIYAQTDDFALTGTCVNPPASKTVDVVTVSATAVETVCVPTKKVIFDVHDTIWFVRPGQNHVRTCDATVTATVTATCTVTEGASTVTVTVGGYPAPAASGPVVIAPVAPSSALSYPSSAPYPVYTPSKNATKPILPTFSSGADNMKSGVYVVAGVAAIVAALVL